MAESLRVKWTKKLTVDQNLILKQPVWPFFLFKIGFYNTFVMLLVWFLESVGRSFVCCDSASSLSNEYRFISSSWPWRFFILLLFHLMFGKINDETVYFWILFFGRQQPCNGQKKSRQCVYQCRSTVCEAWFHVAFDV